MTTYRIKAAGATKPVDRSFWDSVFDVAPNGVLIEPVDNNEETPMAWDLDFDVLTTKGKTFIVLNGGVGPGGFGRVTIEVPIERFDDVYRMEMEVADDADPIDVDTVIAVLRNCGFEVIEVRNV